MGSPAPAKSAFAWGFLLVSVWATSLTSPALARDVGPATINDSSVVKSDTTAGDSAAANAPPDTITYNARLIQYDAATRVLHLNGEAQLHYQDMHLTADTIEYNTQTSMLEAVGRPELQDRQDEIMAEWMAYNVKTRWGKARFATTEMEKGLYNGRNIRKTDKEVLLVANGDYTTCTDVDTSHYFFYGRRMKIVARDKVVARPVVMNIADVPVLTLPYFVFPVKTGRRSGVLMPRWGGSEHGDAGKGTRYLDNLGYYVAPNDYCDFALRTKITEFRDVQAHGQANYALRYWLKGYLGGSMLFAEDNFQMSRRWDLKYAHDQTITPDRTFTLKGQGSLMGDRQYREKTSTDLEEIINKRINAHLTLNKRWAEQNVNLTIGARQDRDLEKDEIVEQLPNVSFGFGQRLLFKPPQPVETEKEDADTLVDEEPKWYHAIYYGFDNSGSRRRTQDAAGDFTRAGATHRFSARSPQTLLRWYTISPNFSYDESWFDSELSFDTLVGASMVVDTLRNDTTYHDSVVADTTAGFYRRGNYRTGVSMETKLYGTFPVPVGRFAGIRHTLTPNVSYTFSPKQENGFRYRHVGMGNTGDSEKQQTVSFGIGNLFQGKLNADEASKKRESKFTILSVNVNSAYNFVADSLKLKDLQANASTNILNRLSLGYNSTYQFYNKQRKIGVPWLTRQNFNARTGLRFSGKWWNGELATESDSRVLPTGSAALVGEPWSMNLRYNYQYKFSQTIDKKVTHGRSYSLDGSSDLKLTKTWQVNYSAKYDFTSNQLAYQRINFHKDLHCWQLVFNWTPTGPSKGYYFKVDIRQIPDVKIEKDGRHSGSGY